MASADPLTTRSPSASSPRRARLTTRYGSVVGCLLTLVLLPSGSASAVAEENVAAEPVAAADEIAIDFNRQIRPILSDHCFACHGPDANTLQADLRLDIPEGLFDTASSGERPIVAGDAGASELLRRILTSDEGERMPPADDGKPLTPEQIELLTKWIEQGAVWTGHWAFEPIVEPVVPQDGLAAGVVHNPIDAFVLSRLASAGMSQAPLESRERLIRRVSLDLTGLPPTIEEVEAFVADDSPRAFEAVVDRLLGSQHFGERLALPWLDLARYGDTSGYHNDSLRDMWLWRQGVIEAFNANRPFDQFTLEQLAGDLLPDATIEQQIASGFHRNVMTSDEGGLIDAEYRNLYVVDRVATTGVTWLGMTVACAQCHDHKYDPISQEDFYKFYAFFNNVPETGKDGVRDRNPVPFLRVPSPDDEQRQRELERMLSEAEAELAAFKSGADERQAAWEQQAVVATNPSSLPEPIGQFPLADSGDGQGTDDEPIAAVPHGDPAFLPDPPRASFHTDNATWFDYGERFGFEKDEAFSVGAYLSVTAKGGAPLGKMDDANGARGWDIEFHGLRPSVHLIHRWPDDVIHIQADQDLPADTVTHVAFTYDGSGKAAGLKLYVNGLLFPTSIKKDALQGSIRSDVGFCIGRRGTGGTQFAGRIADVRVFDRNLSADQVAAWGAGEAYEILAIAKDERTAEQTALLTEFYRQTETAELARRQSEFDATKKSLDDFVRSIPNTMVMKEMDKPRETFIKIRGNYDADGEAVEPGVPNFLPPLAPQSADTRLNRLDFARWLVSPEHPLTARVTVNRWWAMLFGTGLVATLNDFGSQGEPPSHPELLDWLAADLMRDWDTKRVIKQMVLSATYQQASRAAPELLARDADNRLLARGPRQRLDAEVIRDNALAIAGILNPEVGGRSIKPAQPAGTWEINEMSGYKYEKSQGADLYRRGLYVYWRRSTVYPSFVTLDAPTREFCVAQRAKTSTPLQSLVLMNDPVFVEAARALAQRILGETEPDADTRLIRLWRLALSRQPSPEEISVLRRAYDQQVATYQADPEAARQLVAVGDLEKPASLDDTELAVWTALSNVILNLNETISN
ncbi:MAG: DUF1553 domain-containing protein [Planctomycetaceae bacterium]|nr:MAG: DUF1553 domain-containing protein [Planctomycetaceae bacterium]